MVPYRVAVYLEQFTVQTVDIGRTAGEPEGVLGPHRDGEREIGIDQSHVPGETETFRLLAIGTEVHPASDTVIHRAAMFGCLQRDGLKMRTDESRVESHQVVRIIDRRPVDRHQRLVVITTVYMQSGRCFVIRLNTRQTLQIADRIGGAEELRHALDMLHLHDDAFGLLLHKRHRAVLYYLDVFQLFDNRDTTISNSLPDNGQTAAYDKYEYCAKTH